MRIVSAADLVAAVNENLSEDNTIVWSDAIRAVFRREGLRTGERSEEPDAKWNGRHFEAADHAACSDGRLQKWKYRSHNGPVGWSLGKRDDPDGYARALWNAQNQRYWFGKYNGAGWDYYVFDSTEDDWVVVPKKRRR